LPAFRDVCITTSWGARRRCRGVKERLEVEDVVVRGGRLPHGTSISMTSGRQPETARPGRRDSALVQAALDSS
jgi:hypothetical protein